MPRELGHTPSNEYVGRRPLPTRYSKQCIFRTHILRSDLLCVFLHGLSSNLHLYSANHMKLMRS